MLHNSKDNSEHFGGPGARVVGEIVKHVYQRKRFRSAY